MKKVIGLLLTFSFLAGGGLFAADKAGPPKKDGAGKNAEGKKKIESPRDSRDRRQQLRERRKARLEAQVQRREARRASRKLQ